MPAHGDVTRATLCSIPRAVSGIHRRRCRAVGAPLGRGRLPRESRLRSPAPRIIGTRYPLAISFADSARRRSEEGRGSRRPRVRRASRRQGNVRHGFVYERIPHLHAQVDRRRCGDRRDLGQEPARWSRTALDRLDAALHEQQDTVPRGDQADSEGEDVRFDAPTDATLTMPSGR